MENKRAEAKLLFCMGENKRWLSFKKDAYETFDEAIQLLRDADDAYGLRMLSPYHPNNNTNKPIWNTDKTSVSPNKQLVFLPCLPFFQQLLSI